MKIILTEKPSVAKDMAKALGVTYDKSKGYFCSSNYIILNAMGHLLEAQKPDEIDERYKKWQLETLPILPDHLSYQPIATTKKQLNLIKTVLTKTAFEQVIVATDAGREGELIARLILKYAGLRLRSAIC